MYKSWTDPLDSSILVTSLVIYKNRFANHKLNMS